MSSDNCNPCDGVVTSPRNVLLFLPPSPVPPHHRPLRGKPTETLQASGTINLDKRITYLNATDPTSTKAVVLPDGTYPRQWHEIFIPKLRIDRQDSAVWTMTGKFSTFTTLTFNNFGNRAILEWGPDCWQFIGGNAIAG